MTKGLKVFNLFFQMRVVVLLVQLDVSLPDYVHQY